MQNQLVRLNHQLIYRPLLISFTMLLLLGESNSLHAQKIEVKVEYSMKKVAGLKFKVGIAEDIKIELGGKLIKASKLSRDYKVWSLTGGLNATATFKSDESKGIWWEIIDQQDTTIIKLSQNHEDTNDPREFLVQSTGSSDSYTVLNDEPDCNSYFVLFDSEDFRSPKALSGIANTLMVAKTGKPCDKGDWTVNLEEKVPEKITIAFIFSAIQALNVRYLKYL